MKDNHREPMRGDHSLNFSVESGKKSSLSAQKGAKMGSRGECREQ